MSKQIRKLFALVSQLRKELNELKDQLKVL